MPTLQDFTGALVAKDHERATALARELPVTPGPDGMTTLHLACLHGNLDLVRDLLDAGANPRASTPVGHTPLTHAALGGHAAIAAHLIACATPSEAELGTAFEAVGGSLGRSASVAANPDLATAVLGVLLGAGADPNSPPSQGPEGSTRFGRLLERVLKVGGPASLVRIALKHGATVPETFPDTGESPAAAAQRAGRDDIAELLARFGGLADTSPTPAPPMSRQEPEGAPPEARPGIVRGGVFDGKYGRAVLDPAAGVTAWVCTFGKTVKLELAADAFDFEALPAS